jgi:chorismate synthase
MSNSIGQLFRVTSFGESHGHSMSVVVDGCPPGIPLSSADMKSDLERRKAGTTQGSTTRLETDEVEILSGIFQGRTTGAPLTLMVCNHDSDSLHYNKKFAVPRPGHADYTAWVKYGGYNDYRGGGRFSGRITVGFVLAGTIAQKVLALVGVDILAHIVQIGPIHAATRFTSQSDMPRLLERCRQNPLYCADSEACTHMLALLEEIKNKGESVGGAIEGIATNLPVGLGEPVFDTVEGNLAKALFAIPAVKAVEFGAGFGAAGQTGSQHNDAFTMQNGHITTSSNHAGGILGGLTNGMPIVLHVAIKPTPSISKPQNSVDMVSKEPVVLTVEGRHDICIVPRAVVVVEAMMVITLCDFALLAGVIKPMRPQ